MSDEQKKFIKKFRLCIQKMMGFNFMGGGKKFQGVTNGHKMIKDE